MYRKVVVPLDGSELAECSLSKIGNVIGEGSELHLIRVVEPVVSFVAADVPPDIVQRIEHQNVADARDYLVRAAARVSAPGVRVKTDVVWGIPAEQVIDYAARNGADLIVLTTHGRSGISRLTFGSVADKVLRMSRIPVLVIAPPGCRTG